jgi:hypothetical protein
LFYAHNVPFLQVFPITFLFSRLTLAISHSYAFIHTLFLKSFIHFFLFKSFLDHPEAFDHGPCGAGSMGNSQGYYGEDMKMMWETDKVIVGNS